MTKTGSYRLGKTIVFLIGGSVLFVLLLLGAGGYFFLGWVSDWRGERVSQEVPIDIEDHGLSTEDVRALQLRVDDFIQSSTQARENHSLQLRADELTALIAPSLPADKSSSGRFELEDQNLLIRGSIALEEWGYEGQYLNGRLWVSIDKVGGRFRFRLVDFQGQEEGWISGKSLRVLKLQDLTRYAYQHSQLSKILQRTEQIEVRDHLIHFLPKSP